MKTLSTLKTLPLIGLLAMGLALAPAVTIADDDRGRGKGRVYQKHDGGKGHHREHRKSHRDGKGHRDHGHYKKHGRHKGHSHGSIKHAYNHSRHGHKHGHKHHGHKHHGHKHHGHGHRHADYVVVHDHYYDDYDPFRLMLGLHFDNIDIIYRDF